MKIGASGSTTRELAVPDAIALAADVGYRAFEVWVEYLWDQGTPPDVVRRAAAARGLALSLHGPQRDLNITSTNAGIRAESRRQYLAALDAAADVGAQIVVLHPGAMSSAGDDPATFWPPLEEFLRAAAERAAALGLRVGIEHMERRRLEYATTPELVVAMLQRIDHPALGLTLDLAHQFSNGDELRLDALLPHIIHVHVSGSTRDRVHVPLAEGIYALEPALAVLEQAFGGMVVIEGYVRGRARETLADNLRVMTELLNPPAP